MPPKPFLAPPFYPASNLRGPRYQATPVRGYYQVRDYTCGFASTLTVLHSFRRYVAPKDLFDRLGTDRTGTRQTAIVRELRGHGLSASVRYDLDFDGIARHVDAGSLVIAYHHNLEHWLVLFGYARDPASVLVADPWPAHRSEHLWETYGPKLGGFGIVCRGRRAGRRVTAPIAALEPAGAAPAAPPADAVTA